MSIGATAGEPPRSQRRRPREVPERFLVALSFSGVEREFVRSIAEAVERRLGPSSVFFDDWYEFYIGGHDADLKLQRLYGAACELAVVCVSATYGSKAWTRAEHEAIRSRLMQARAEEDPRQRDRIFPIRVGDGNVDGIPFNAIVSDVRGRTPDQVAELITDRLQFVMGSAGLAAQVSTAQGSGTSAAPPAPRSPAPRITAPTPAYPNAQVQTLSEELASARVRKQTLRDAGIATHDVDREILELRRKLRDGGQLRSGASLGDERYLLVKSVGRGGFAVVWEAWDRAEQQRVAIKVLHHHLVSESQRKERFFRGARVMRELQHPAIVRVLDPRGEDDSFCYFVMELMPGGNLREAVLSNRVEAGRRLALILQVGEALAEAHRKLLVHRDIKPANILLDGDGNAKLTDFDLVGAHDTTGGTRTGTLGTVVYAAPECLDRPQDATARADVFGLGMTAIFCLAGHDLSMDTLVDRAGALAQLDCTASIRKVLERAVEWKPDRRFADAAEMVDALRDALAVSSQRATADDRRAVVTQPAVPPSSVPPAVDPSRANDDGANSGSTLQPAHKRFRAAVVRKPVIAAVAVMLSLVSGVAFVALRGGESTGDEAATSSLHGSATAAPSAQVVQPPVDSPPPTASPAVTEGSATAAPSTPVVQPPVNRRPPTVSPAVTKSAHGAAARGGPADQLFKKGQRLLAEKRYAEACMAFEDSERVDPAIGTKLNAGRCYQEWGKLATAWRWYTDAEQMASQVGDTRTPEIHALIEDIDRDVPHLMLVLPPGAVTDHLAIRLDGVALALATVDDERRIDPGPHEIEITIDDKPRTKMIPVVRGDRLHVALDVPTRPARGGGR